MAAVVDSSSNIAKNSSLVLQPYWDKVLHNVDEDVITHPLFFIVTILITVFVVGFVFSFLDVFVTHRVSFKITALYFALVMPAYCLAYFFVWVPITYRHEMTEQWKTAPTVFEFCLQLSLCLIVGEISSYWWHRLEHANYYVWNYVHYFHHSYEYDLSVWSGLYVHPIESFVVFCMFYWYPFVTLMHPLTFSVYGFFNTYITMVTHCGYDIPWYLYPSIFASYPVHKHHHAKRLRKSESGGVSTKNFSVLLKIGDVLFGTFVEPDSKELDPTEKHD